jgi:hypothetical protein
VWRKKSSKRGARITPTTLHSKIPLEVEDYGLKESVRKVSPKIRAEPFLTPPWFFDK